METCEANLFQANLEKEILLLTNREGISYSIPLKFLAKETNVGDQYASYQILRLKHSGLFSMDELYSIAGLIQQNFPASYINWESTFHIIHKDKTSSLHKKLKSFKLI
jgi:hypothetical protein